MIVAAVLGALQARFGTLPALTTPKTVTVHIGLPMTADSVNDLVLLGHDGEEDSEVGVTVAYEWANIAGTSRYENGTIPGAIICQSGDTDMLARFTRAAVLGAAMENALVSDMNSGTPLGGLVMGAMITLATPRSLQNQAGARVLQPFTVTYRAQV